MKSDKSIKGITLASLQRKATNVKSWKFYQIIHGNHSNIIEIFNLEIGELPIFLCSESTTQTLISTRRIIIKNQNEFNSISFQEIQEIEYGDFKGQFVNNGTSSFSLKTINDERLTFYYETGEAAIGLIYTFDTIWKIYKSESLADFIAELKFLSTREGGRAVPAYNGYRPTLKFDFMEMQTSGDQQYIGSNMVYPGQTINAEITVLSPKFLIKKLEVGQKFEFREGNTIIGYGKVIEILNKQLGK